MLQIGKQAAQNSHLDNMVFVKGNAEELPVLDNSFDILFSRLAFHHFTDIESIFREMVRVLKPGGKFVLIDMEAAEETLRKSEDEIETLRDPSHVKNLSRNERLELTKTPDNIRQLIYEHLTADIKGQEKTGFYPYQTDRGVCFHQKWVLIVGIKPT